MSQGTSCVVTLHVTRDFAVVHRGDAEARTLLAGVSGFGRDQSPRMSLD